MSDDLAQRITDALRGTFSDGHGSYFFDGGLQSHDEAEARAIIESCLRLDIPITDRITSHAWLAIIRRLDRLEDKP